MKSSRQPRLIQPPARFQRRGTLLLMVLMTGSIVAVIGLGALIVQRTHLDSSQLHEQAAQARLAARSAVATGLFRVTSRTDWRTRETPGTWSTDVPLSGALWTLQASDINDTRFDNNLSDPLRLHGIGSSAAARQRTYLELRPLQTLREAFRMNLCCGGRLSFESANVQSTAWLGSGRDVTISGSNTVSADVRSAGSVPSTGLLCRRVSSAAIPGVPDWSVLTSVTAAGQPVSWSAVPLQTAPQINVVGNGDFGNGVHGWEATGGAHVRSYSSGGNGNGACVQLEDRSTTTDALVYDVTGSIRNGVPSTFSARVLPLSKQAEFEITLKVVTPSQTIIAAQWESLKLNEGTTSAALQQISTVLTPVWTGQLKQALLSIRTIGATKAGTQDFRVDDVILALTGPVSGRGLYRQLICSVANPFGVANHARGIYVIDCAGNNITLMDCRIVGTLVFRNVGRVTVRDGVHWETATSALPALLVDGDLELRTARCGLSERELNANFNPAGCPDLNGITNTSKADIYPSVIHGLIAATGNIVIEGDVLCRGAILAKGDLVIRQRLVLERPAERFASASEATHETVHLLRPAIGATRGFD